MAFEETGTERSREILNFERHLMSELLLVGNWQGEKKRENERIKHRTLKVPTLD